MTFQSFPGKPILNYSIYYDYGPRPWEKIRVYKNPGYFCLDPQHRTLLWAGRPSSTVPHSKPVLPVCKPPGGTPTFIPMRGWPSRSLALGTCACDSDPHEPRVCDGRRSFWEKVTVFEPTAPVWNASPFKALFTQIQGLPLWVHETQSLFLHYYWLVSVPFLCITDPPLPTPVCGLHGIWLDFWYCLLKNGLQFSEDILSFLKRFYLFILREKGREGGRGRETSMWERNIDRLPLTCPLTGDQNATQARALTGNQTGDLPLCRTTPNPLSHSGHGILIF